LAGSPAGSAGGAAAPRHSTTAITPYMVTNAAPFTKALSRMRLMADPA
jgi:hypothetical protein